MTDFRLPTQKLQRALGPRVVRTDDAPTRWHLQGIIDDDDREELLKRLVELGFDDAGLENHFEKDGQTFVLGDYHWIATISSDR